MEFFREGNKFVVEWDDCDHFMNDPDIEQEMKDYVMRQIDGGYSNFFSVIEFKKCGECDSWHGVGSLHGIMASSEEDAIDQYLECVEVRA